MNSAMVAAASGVRTPIMRKEIITLWYILMSLYDRSSWYYAKDH